MNETILVGEFGSENEHEIGNRDCNIGWYGGTNYPCSCVCGGLIHAEFGDETEDGYWIWRRCDKCGDDWEEDA